MGRREGNVACPKGQSIAEQAPRAPPTEPALCGRPLRRSGRGGASRSDGTARAGRGATFPATSQTSPPPAASWSSADLRRPSGSAPWLPSPHLERPSSLPKDRSLRRSSLRTWTLVKCEVCNPVAQWALMSNVVRMAFDTHPSVVLPTSIAPAAGPGVLPLLPKVPRTGRGPLSAAMPVTEVCGGLSTPTRSAP